MKWIITKKTLTEVDSMHGHEAFHDALQAIFNSIAKEIENHCIKKDSEEVIEISLNYKKEVSSMDNGEKPNVPENESEKPEETPAEESKEETSEAPAEQSQDNEQSEDPAPATDDESAPEESTDSGEAADESAGDQGDSEEGESEE